MERNNIKKIYNFSTFWEPFGHPKSSKLSQAPPRGLQGSKKHAKRGQEAQKAAKKTQKNTKNIYKKPFALTFKPLSFEHLSKQTKLAIKILSGAGGSGVAIRNPAAHRAISRLDPPSCLFLSSPHTFKPLLQTLNP